MAQFSMIQIAALWIKAGGSLASAPVAVAHAWAESSGNSMAQSPNPDGGTNWGLWQLDTKGVGAGHPVSALQDPLTSTQITVKATGDGKNWGSWADNWPSDLGRAQSAVSQLAAQSHGNPGGLGGVVDLILKDLTGGLGAITQNPLSTNVLQLPSQVTDFLSAGERFVHSALWIIDPTNWARIIAGAVAAVLLILGIGALTRAA